MSDIEKSKIRRLDFTLLMVMQGLLRHGRTVDVADELGLSQPAISHALARLRELFGDPLFLRKPHGLVPTRHAIELAPLIESMLDQARDAVGLAERFDPATATRAFRIGSPDLLGPLIIAPLIRQFRKAAPEARLMLRTIVGREASRAVQQDQLDLAVGQFGRVIDSGLSAQHLYDDEYVLLTRAAHPTAGANVTVAMLNDLEFVIPSPSGEFRGYPDGELERSGVQRRIIAAVPRFSTALELVRRTDVAMLALGRLADLYVSSFRLEARYLPVHIHAFSVLMLRRVNRDPGLDWLAGVVHRALAQEGSGELAKSGV